MIPSADVVTVDEQPDVLDDVFRCYSHPLQFIHVQVESVGVIRAWRRRCDASGP